MAKFSGIAKKIQSAINSRSPSKITISTQQWYSDDKRRPVMCYTIRKSDEINHRETTVLFKTYSQIQMVLFLRDYWYKLNGWEIPTDNEIWEEVKRRNGIEISELEEAEESDTESETE